MSLSDAEQRQQALATEKSFIVQAPAGSGKTTLLTQRFLKLLSQVNKPEEILAITFTRKAASEMRERILGALQQTQENSSSDNLTNKLAQQALARDQDKEWHLLTNPSRLQIKTIDSLCAGLTKALPLLAQFGAQPKVSDQPSKLYQEAIDSLANDLNQDLAWTPAIRSLLLYLDNNLHRVNQLLGGLLAKRDRWLPLIMACRQTDQLRQQLEIGLQQINTEILITLAQEIQLNQLEEQLTELLQFASQHAPEGSLIKAWQQQLTWPTTSHQYKNFWLALPELLLTSDNKWRKTLNKNQGFPAPSSTTNKLEKAQYEQMKQQAKTLLEKVAASPELLDALTELKLSPPLHYNEQQWQLLDALLVLLPIACAKLKLSFATHAEVDFTELLLASLTALGEEEAPTNLALALDYRLQHILVDEFQDTSSSQFRLLEKLTLGWQAGDGRSLFLVGDPMQSIYRFRQAEVSLFLRCQKYGLNDLALTSLTLHSNFRSQAILVNWFNDSFQTIFPSLENFNLGAVCYSNSHATHTTTSWQINYQLALTDRQAEAQQVVNIIKENPDATIAILVQARHHLSAILPALQQANIVYQGLDLDPLLNRPAIQDLLALTYALLDLDDRINWLAILRAPWCGLTLTDLHIVSRTEEHETIWQRLTNPFVLAELSTEGAQRADHFIAAMSQALENRFRQPFTRLVKTTWLNLGGELALLQPQDQLNCQSYFNCLRDNSQAGTLTEPNNFQQQLASLYAKTTTDSGCLVQIMTIHKAKGLEFDIIILPSLERNSPGLDPQLLLWNDITTHQQQTSAVLAPIKASHESNDPIYDYLNRREKFCLANENRRLFYVAATRAKNELHLLACQTNRIGKDSFLNYLLSAYPELKPNPIETEETSADIDKPTIKLSRLSLTALSNFSITSTAISGHNNLAPNQLNWQADHSRLIGTLTHRILQQVIEEGLHHWPENRLDSEQANWLTALQQAGLPEDKLSNTVKIIKENLLKTLNDPNGQWLLDSHPVSHAEFTLSNWHNGKVKQFSIDRILIDKQGQLWLADFKTMHFDSTQALEPQLQQAKLAYQQQLHHYQNLVENYFNQPARYGLYFTDLPYWLECSGLAIAT